MTFSELKVMKAYMYILECNDGSYYTGSTNDLDLRLAQHQNGEGSNYTKDRLPVELVYYEEYQRIDDAFYREKQIQRWTRKKKEALINNTPELLPSLSRSYAKSVPEPVEGTGGRNKLSTIMKRASTGSATGKGKSMASTGSATGKGKSMASTGSATGE